MGHSQLPSDPLEAHAVVLQRAEQIYEQRREQRRKPLPEQAQAEVRLLSRNGEPIAAEVLDVSPRGMRLAAFADQAVLQGDRCLIVVSGSVLDEGVWATVRWVTPHPLIQVFGVELDQPQEAWAQT